MARSLVVEKRPPRRRARHDHTADPDDRAGGRTHATEGARRGRRAARARGVEAAARPPAAGRVRLGSAKRTGGGRPHPRAEAGPGAARRADAADRRLRRRPRHRSGAHAAGDLRDRARPVCDPRVRGRGDRLSAQAGHARSALRSRSSEPSAGYEACRTRRARDRCWRCSMPSRIRRGSSSDSRFDPASAPSSCRSTRWIGSKRSRTTSRLHAGLATHLLHVPMNTIEARARFRPLPAHPSIAHRERPAHRAAVVDRARPVRHRAASRAQRLQSGRTYGERIRRALYEPVLTANAGWEERSWVRLGRA